MLDTGQFLQIAHAMDHEAMDQPLLRVRGLEAGYGDVQVLWGIDLDVARNSIVAIVGPNGAGKTTYFNLISGQLRASEGLVAVARIALPSLVRVMSRCTPTMATTAMPMIASWLAVNVIDPNLYDGP